MEKKKWIAITAASALGVGLLSAGAVATADSLDIRDADGDRVANTTTANDDNRKAVPSTMSAPTTISAPETVSSVSATSSPSAASAPEAVSAQSPASAQSPVSAQSPASAPSTPSVASAG
jgi:hypothetical protein